MKDEEINPVVLFLDYKQGKFQYKTGPIPEYISLTNGFKTVNGYSGHTFPFQNYIETSLQDENVYDELFIFLSNLGLTHIIILSYDKTLNQYLNSNKNKFESFKIIQDSHVEIEWKKVQIEEEVNYVKNNRLDFHIKKSINPKKHNFLTDSQHSTYWEGQKHGLQTKEDFLQITIDDAPKDFGILMNNGPFVNRFAYGLDVFCGDKKVGGYNLPKFSIPTFLNNPYGNQHLSINIKNCAGNLLELRVNKISEYSFWSISQFEIYSDK
ncbi:MAG: hypothetical protein JJT78_00135 [Leptospira sp.]|nr:hypothetical protein [Leptospira sp.]